MGDEPTDDCHCQTSVTVSSSSPQPQVCDPRRVRAQPPPNLGISTGFGGPALRNTTRSVFCASGAPAVPSPRSTTTLLAATTPNSSASDPGSDPILIFGLEGEMFFGAAPNLERHFESIEARILPSTQVLVLRLKRFRTPDAVGMHLLEDFLARVHGRGVTVLTCGVRDELYRAFEKTGLAEDLTPEHVFREEPVRQTSTMLAVRHAYALVDGAHAARGA